MGRLDAVLAYAKAQPKFFVYAISDLAGKPVYVGRSEYPERRYSQHKSCKVWQQPLRMWVADNPHTFEILDTYPTNRMMIDAEQQYIAYLTPEFNALPR